MVNNLASNLKGFSRCLQEKKRLLSMLKLGLCKSTNVALLLIHLSLGSSLGF